MKILGETYNVIDTFDSDMTVPDCLVATKNKLGKGHGESKLYVASKDVMRAFYGNEGFVARCFLLKDDLKQYMNAIKPEYLRPTYDYRGKDKMSKLWEDRMKDIELLDDIIYFNVSDQAQIAGPRGYVNSDDEGYQLIREISLPLVSYISVMKVTPNGKDIYYYWKLFVDYDMINADEALVFNYGKQREDDIIPQQHTQEKKRVELGRARLGQGKYRDALLEECIFCPITMINDERLLIASHIKPWAVSTDKEKVDPKNGFILSPLYDKLFDKGLISFTDDKHLIVSNWISPSNIKRMELENNKYYPKLPIDEQRIAYLNYHRAYVFKG
ncbi:MAG: HNH endonuclease [Alistipes sp.]|nr:HNH endonuclease [Alistipes sp.]